MRKFWSNSDKPVKMTADERAREIFNLVMTVNEDLGDDNKVRFSYNPDAECISVSTGLDESWADFSWYQSDTEPDKKYAKLIKTLRTWHAETLIAEMEKTYEEEVKSEP